VKQFVIVTVFFILVVNPMFAQTTEEDGQENFAASLPATAAASDKKVFATFSYGAASSWLTRIIYQTERSNFVLRDFFSGLYFALELQNTQNIIPEIRLAAYYPFVSTFNHVPQMPNTPLHYAADLFTGFRLEIEWNFLRLNAGPGLHVFYMSSDRWNYLNMGFAATAGIELAITPGWSFMINGIASIDNGNLGANGNMEPFDITYQYQTGIGIRYSKNKRSDSALFMPKDIPIVILDR